MSNWWDQHLAELEADGRKDAEAGVFKLPWPIDDNDMQNDDENAAYRKGFDARRKEMGNAFKYA